MADALIDLINGTANPLVAPFGGTLNDAVPNGIAGINAYRG